MKPFASSSMPAPARLRRETARAAALLFCLIFIPKAPAQVMVAPGVLHMGTIQSTNINESSGLSLAHRGRQALWTHNDGDDQLFGLSTQGHSLGRWRLNGVRLIDWEDLAWSPGRLYVADIGDNELSRPEIAVYSFPEPAPTFSGRLPLKGVWRLAYPDGLRFDAESLVVHGPHGYIVTKTLVGGMASVYRFPLGRPRTRRVPLTTLEPLGALEVDDAPGGSDISPDGWRLAVITSAGAYLFDLTDGWPTGGPLRPVLFVAFQFDRMEGCAFGREGLWVTSESRDIFLFTEPAFRL